MRAELIAFLAVVGNALALPNASSVSSAPTAQVKNGTYVGVHSAEYNQDFFLGIPYAQPPVGELRFRVPQSLDGAWNGTKDATAYSKECVGYGSDQLIYETSEDCLYLNIVRPSGYENTSLPVGFWIPGGGYYQGGGVDQRFNLSFIVENAAAIGKPFIGVTTNYRLSGWGFLMGDEVQESGQTNLGLRDQRLAMHWLQENVAAFGGDPSKVTIWGESAGASSVGFQLTAYDGRDDSLFRGAIMESGSPVYYQALMNSTGFQSNYTALLSATGCANATESLGCLRALPYATLNDALNTTDLKEWGPAIDGDFIAGKTSLQLAAGKFVHVPVISGANSDEGTAFTDDGINNSTQLLNAILLLDAGYPDVPKLGIPGSPPLGPLPDDYRPGGDLGIQYRRSAALYGDYQMVGNRRLTCETWAAEGLDAFCYRFNAIPATSDQDKGITHFDEVAWVFNNVNGVGYEPVAIPPFTGKGQSYIDLAKLMSSSWASFIVDLNPNGFAKGNLTKEDWPVYRLEDPKNYVFDANVTSFAEPDTWRQEGIKLINEHAADMFSR
ncbi:alpha/beta-hydrolase [Saccharata proteae CBS 121410]|uniref:Carboxylic ester hydrolase n=1 Tax=Saccharata proteae CBS 121410 TaxID=1314787 RepID=A0A9P4HUT2_9PEZI|nr:alpha/beta-hydrolase [Saccharata proteae CBS 121410]